MFVAARKHETVERLAFQFGAQIGDAGRNPSAVVEPVGLGRGEFGFQRFELRFERVGHIGCNQNMPGVGNKRRRGRQHARHKPPHAGNVESGRVLRQKTRQNFIALIAHAAHRNAFGGLNHGIEFENIRHESETSHAKLGKTWANPCELRIAASQY